MEALDASLCLLRNIQNYRSSDISRTAEQSDRLVDSSNEPSGIRNYLNDVILKFRYLKNDVSDMDRLAKVLEDCSILDDTLRVDTQNFQAMNMEHS